MEQLSNRGRSNITEIMNRIPAAILEGINSNDDSINLSMAENWLVRQEVLDICKASIQNNFDTHVSG